MNPYAFVFPGQGSQSIGMMRGFEGVSVVRETFAEASDYLRQDLWRLVAEGPEDEMAQTVNTQPLMLVAGVAVLRAWVESGGGLPAYAAGHSLGEYTALVAAEVLSFREAVPLVRLRAQAMQDAVPVGSGAIAALLGLSEPQVREVCVEAAGGEVLEPANLNTPTQTVIAGSRAAVLRGIEVAKRRGAKRALLLPMSAPSHCALMAPACDQLRGYLSQVVVAPPKIPVIQNADVLAHREPEHIRDALIRQLCSPVRWVETIRYLADAGVTQVMECGPGKVLSGLTKRIVESGVQSFALADSAALAEARATGVH